MIICEQILLLNNTVQLKLYISVAIMPFRSMSTEILARDLQSLGAAL